MGTELTQQHTMTMKIRNLAALALGLALASCSGETQSPAEPRQPGPPPVQVNVPAFNPDSAYRYVAEQVAFGPRVPNTPAHDSCAAYLAAKLASFGAEVVVQRATVQAWDGTPLRIQNIVGQFQPEKASRLLLFAHWDTRPYADEDADASRRQEPILGANDGASGVGVLLEMARLLGQTPTSLGVDIIFFDAEDYGNPTASDMESWCLGSAHWARQPHKAGYRARNGILLDMVGGHGATFTQESYSLEYAPDMVRKFWRAASDLGYSGYFPVVETRFVGIDDHVPVSEIAGIPSINIIQFNPENGGFGSFWHTHDDDMDAVSKTTLEAVGRSLARVVYSEQ